jgi:hypothetical protein
MGQQYVHPSIDDAGMPSPDLDAACVQPIEPMITLPFTNLTRTAITATDPPGIGTPSTRTVPITLSAMRHHRASRHSPVSGSAGTGTAGTGTAGTAGTVVGTGGTVGGTGGTVGGTVGIAGTAGTVGGTAGTAGLAPRHLAPPVGLEGAGREALQRPGVSHVDLGMRVSGGEGQKGGVMVMMRITI